ncbi:hypothetical protein [Arenicella xantha]|nr:hypothetical protein [Arenicella xantha]
MTSITDCHKVIRKWCQNHDKSDALQPSNNKIKALGYEVVLRQLNNKTIREGELDHDETHI